MSIYGITAGHNEAFLKEFLHDGIACASYTSEGPTPGPTVLRQPETEDIIFIKTFTPQTGLRVEAVGVVTSGSISESDMGSCVHVKWLWEGEKLIENLDDNCPERGDSVYEEYNPWVQREIMDLLPSGYGCLPPELSTLTGPSQGKDGMTSPM